MTNQTNTETKLNASEVLKSMSNNLLIGEAKKVFDEEFEKRKDNVKKDFEAAINPEYFINNQITNTADIFKNGKYDTPGILNFKEGNELVKWGFNTVLRRPLILIKDVRKLLSVSVMLLRFSVSNKPTIFLQLLNIEQGKGLLNKKLTENEYLLEALHYVFYGVAGADYLYFLNDLKNGTQLLQPGNSINKIKWLGNPSHLGFIIYQLAEKGYIEFPVHNGEINYTGLAGQLLNGFEFKDKQPTKKYLSEQINPESDNNKMGNTAKTKLKLDIAFLKDLS